MTLASAGFMWPQLYLSSMMEHRPRRRPFYIFATVSRITLLIALTGIVFNGMDAYQTHSGQWSAQQEG